jgi:hypothetical protein
MTFPTIVTGYHETEGSYEFPEIWSANTRKHFPQSPIITIGVGGDYPCYTSDSHINLSGNLGHVGDLLHGRNYHQFCGWSAAVLAGAMLCYINETDMVYKEQDVLCFGAPLFQMQRQLGNKCVIFGKCQSNQHACAQSLFMVRHAYIPEFVRLYLNEGSDGRKDNLPEIKFKRLMEKHPDQWCQFDFGVDRDRPLPWDAPTWYAQRFTKEELDELERRKLI